MNDLRHLPHWRSGGGPHELAAAALAFVDGTDAPMSAHVFSAG